METIKFLVNVFYLYLLAGAVFAAIFLWRGATALDEAVKGISWKTRMLLFPGSAALWPVLLRKWLKAASTPEVRSGHSTPEVRSGHSTPEVRSGDA